MRKIQYAPGAERLSIVHARVYKHDGRVLEAHRAAYGQTLVCGYARIGGWAVGIVANQKKNVTTSAPGTGEKRIEFGGVIYTEASDKASRFILDCNQNLVPLIFLHDVNGFMVGKEAEWSGIIRAGAKMVNAVSNSVVPKITVILGGTFGAEPVGGYYTTVSNSQENLVVGTEQDSHLISFVGMSDPTLNAKGTFTGSTTFSLDGSFDCANPSSPLYFPGLPEGTCTATGATSLGTFQMTGGHGAHITGAFATQWSTPSLFTYTVVQGTVVQH